MTHHAWPRLIGMIHVGALPGTPRHHQPIAEILAASVAEARLYAEAGFDALLLENMHDLPYLRATVGPEIVAAMTVVGQEIRAAVSLPIGVQVLAAANQAALCVAHAIDASFIRVEGFVFAHVADEGVIEACAGPLLRLRREIGATGVRILADVKKKHASHAVTADISIADAAKAAEFFGADGVILTGGATGQEASPEELAAVQHVTRLPAYVGSGINPNNLPRFERATGWIVGSSLKAGGVWSGALDPAAVHAMANAARLLRSDG